MSTQVLLSKTLPFNGQPNRSNFETVRETNICKLKVQTTFESGDFGSKFTQQPCRVANKGNVSRIWLTSIHQLDSIAFLLNFTNANGSVTQCEFIRNRWCDITELVRLIRRQTGRLWCVRLANGVTKRELGNQQDFEREWGRRRAIRDGDKFGD